MMLLAMGHGRISGDVYNPEIVWEAWAGGGLRFLDPEAWEPTHRFGSIRAGLQWRHSWMPFLSFTHRISGGGSQVRGFLSGAQAAHFDLETWQYEGGIFWQWPLYAGELEAAFGLSKVHMKAAVRNDRTGDLQGGELNARAPWWELAWKHELPAYGTLGPYLHWRGSEQRPEWSGRRLSLSAWEWGMRWGCAW